MTTANSNDLTISSIVIMPHHVHLFVSAQPKCAPGQILKALNEVPRKSLLSMFLEVKVKSRSGHVRNLPTNCGTAEDVTRETFAPYMALQKRRE